MWKGQARIELNLHTPKIQRFRILLVLALIATLMQALPTFVETASATAPYNSLSNEACAASIANSNQNSGTVAVESKWDGTYCYLRFTTEVVHSTTANNWQFATGTNSFDYLVVGGGGGGGNSHVSGYEAGGGGAGGLVYGTFTSSASINISIQIGAGGAGGADGADSYLINRSNSQDIARGYGGGAGGTWSAGHNGGSGGGGSHDKAAGGTGTSGQGNSGGTPTASSRGGGGGGWASAGNANSHGGNGFVDSTYTYWPSGSASSYYTLAWGGAGVSPGSAISDSGTGGVTTGSYSNGGDATNDTGSGGGGGYTNAVATNGGHGGDGVVYIKYIPSQTDGLNLFCYADSGNNTFTKTVIDAASSVTSDAIWPFPGDDIAEHNYNDFGPRDCGTWSGSSWEKYTEYLTGYIKAPVGGTVYLVGYGDDGISINVEDDSANGYRNVMESLIDDGGNARKLSTALTWTAGKWYKIGIWHHENGGGSRFMLRYNTTTNGATTASDQTISRTNLNTLKGSAATLAYQSPPGLVNQTLSPIFTSTSNAASDGAKTYSTPTNAYCSVNSSTGVVTTLATGPCYITVRTARTATFSAQVYSVRIRTAVTPLSETDTALNLNTNARAAYKSDWTLMAKSMTMASEQSFTVEAWINPTQTTGNILQLGTAPSAGSTNSGFKVFLEAASTKAILKVAFSGFGSSTITCDREVPLNRWSHVAIGITLGTAGRATSRVKCYLDGFLVADVTPSSPQDASISNGLWIGNDSSFANTLGGLVDEVKIWNTLRTQSQIQTDLKEYTAPSSNGLVGYFNFNEGEASVAFNNWAYGDDFSDLTISSISSSNWVPVTSATVGATGAEAYTYWQFNRSYITAYGGWKVPSGITRAKILMVGGGGAGGNIVGGGGGAGGLYATILNIGGYETVTIGVGGVGYYKSTNAHASNGGHTYFADKAAYGGGGGGSPTASNISGNSGGSGGGAAYYSGSSGLPAGGSAPGYGATYAGGTATSYGAGGGGGASASGSSATSSSAGAGGAGYLSSITGIATCYATGGGGAENGGSQSTAGGTCSGLTNPNYNNGSAFYNKYETWISPNTGSGGGGAGSSNDALNTSMGQAGSAGVVIVRYLTPLKPAFTIPAAVDTTTAGKAYQFAIGGSALNPLTRTYTWQWTNGTPSTWVNYSTTDTSTLKFASPETMTSGANYSYRVIVTDSDSDGFSTTDTSTAFYLVINPRNTINSSTGSNTLSLKYGDTLTATFSFSYGTGTRTPSYAATTANQAGSFVWSNASSNSITFTVVPGVWAGTYTETLTITDSVSAFTTQAITIILGKADTVTVSTTLPSSSKNYDTLPGPVGIGSISGLKGSDTAVASSATSCRTGGTCVVGDIAPGGGYVFYVSSTVIDSATGISSGGLYLATAPTNNWSAAPFCGLNTFSDYSGYAQGYGGGADNTRRLASSCTTGSFMKTASNLSITDAVTNEVINDWFVPSEYELLAAMKFYVALSPTGTLPVQDASGSYYYWSSYVQNYQQTQVIIKTIVSPYYTSLPGDGSTNNNYSFVGMPIRAFSPTKNSVTYTAKTCAAGGTCTVGDAAPGGGYVFYVTGNTIDSETGISEGGMYLATAPLTAISSGVWCSVDQGLSTTYSSAFGTGASNTKLLSNTCASTTVGPVTSGLWDINGYDDWFLPSAKEATEIYGTLISTNKVSLAAFVSKLFWTSTRNGISSAFYADYTSAGLGSTTSSLSRANVLQFWPIRAFSPAVVNSYSPPSDAGVYDVAYTPVFNSAVNTTNYQAIVYNKATYTINRATPPPMILPIYGGIVGSPLYFSVYGGNGNGPLFRSVVTPGASACTLDTSTVTLNATAAGPCIVRTVHGGNKNVFTDTLTATIYWMVFLPDVVVSTPSGPHAIPISDGNQVSSRTETVTSTSFTDINGVGISSAAVNTRIRILVTGFGGLSPSDLTVYFKPYEDAVINEVTATYVDVTIPSTAITGKIGIDGPRGVTYSPIFTVTP